MLGQRRPHLIVQGYNELILVSWKQKEQRSGRGINIEDAVFAFGLVGVETVACPLA